MWWVYLKIWFAYFAAIWFSMCTLGPDQVPKTCVSGFWSTNCRFEVPNISWTMSFLMFSNILRYYIWWFWKAGCNTLILGKILSEKLFSSSNTWFITTSHGWIYLGLGKCRQNGLLIFFFWSPHILIKPSHLITKGLSWDLFCIYLFSLNVVKKQLTKKVWVLLNTFFILWIRVAMKLPLLRFGLS